MNLHEKMVKGFASGGPSLIPTGAVLPFAGTTAPNGWLLCYGQSVLRTDYPDLFEAIGTAYGAVDSTHFTLPDARGRVTAGKDNMGGTAASRLTTAGSGVDGATLGASGGAETHTLTAAQIPAHAHPIAVGGGSNGTGANANYWQGANVVGAGSSTSNNTGGGSAHPNAQPTLIMNKIIKT